VTPQPVRTLPGGVSTYLNRGGRSNLRRLQFAERFVVLLVVFPKGRQGVTRNNARAAKVGNEIT